MDSLIIQVGGKPGRVRELVRSRGETVRIGRGLDNDIVLTDPYVAPAQASFRCEDGRWFFENHDDTNPVLLNNDDLPAQKVSLESGDRLQLGRTEVRVFSPDHSIPPTRKLLVSGWAHQDSIGFLIPLLALLGCNLLNFGVEYLLDATREVEWKDYVIDLLWMNLFLLVWTGIWAITGKLVRHQYHFGQQLFIGTIWLILFILIYPLLGYVEFASNGASLSTAISVIVMLLMFAVLAKFNLYFATSGRHATAIGIVISFALVGGVSAINILSQDDFKVDAETSSELYPGFVLPGNGEPVSRYFAEVEEILERAQEN